MYVRTLVARTVRHGPCRLAVVWPSIHSVCQYATTMFHPQSIVGWKTNC